MLSTDSPNNLGDSGDTLDFGSRIHLAPDSEPDLDYDSLC